MSSGRSGAIKFTFIMLVVAAAGCDDQAAQPPTDSTISEDHAPQFSGSTQCAQCHDTEMQSWLGSHHQLAMQEATPQTVLGDFDEAEFDYFTTKNRFFTRDGRFWVETDNAVGELEEFAVRYVFGVDPLQQYLIEFPGGRLQSLTVAWDNRTLEDGGQRWFHLYPDEYIAHDDPLHWTGRQQNWNYMCAECHATRLEKNYTLKDDTFATTWAEINVACEACHGPGSAHIRAAQAGTLEQDSGLLVDLDDHRGAVWQMNATTGIAERSELLMQPQAQPEACGRCHARRSMAASEYVYGKSLLDTHGVSLLANNLYYPDGQIRDEVYVYGSFLQSKMYRAGVTCSDCHNPHTATLKTGGAVSDVCATCHLPTVFATAEHHRHQGDAVECVDCHMPARIYMGVDGRRDHSFRIPRPDLTVSTGSPNACNTCHDAADADWAAGIVADWYGDVRPAHYGNALHLGQIGAVRANPQLADVANDATHPGIARATALTLLTPPHTENTTDAVRSGLASSDALIRIGALRALGGFPPEAQVEWVVPLLTDPIRSVRVEAFGVLSPLRQSLPQSSLAEFQRAEREYIDAQLAIAERPEALGNLGNLFVAAGNQERALQFYRLAMRKDPANVAVRVNLADLHRHRQQDAEAEMLLREGLKLDVGSADLRHALGLLLVRGQRHEEALAELEQAAEFDPNNARYAYVYGIALNSLQQPDRAISVLTDANERFPANFEIGWGLVTVLRDHGRMDEARDAARRLSERFPDNANVPDLLQSF